MFIYSLEAGEPLTKTFKIDLNGHITKSNYPPVFRFSSTEHNIGTLAEFHRMLVSVASKGHCLVKGMLNKPLHNESRAGSTDSDGLTQWICLDIDGLTGFESIADFMNQHPQLKDISYVVQYSSSSGMPDSRGLHAHVFMLLSAPYHATYLKGWLTMQNVDGNLFEGKIVKQLSLNRTQSTLRYPIDITACQNDKLLYVAPPIIERGVKYTPPEGGFIQLVKKSKNQLPIERLEHGSVEKQKAEAKSRFNILRREAGLDIVKGKTKLIDGFNIEPECGEFQITGQREERGFVYFNMNGGDSWSWYHPAGNYRFIHCFKDERTYLTERILPNYFKKKEQERKQAQEAPLETGEIVLAFRDLKSATYFNGIWNPFTRILDLHQAKSETQLDHFLQQHGRPEGIIDFIPQWNVEFNPRSDIICVPEERYLNTYVPSPYFLAPRAPAPDLSGCPMIERVILSAVSLNQYSEVTEHFLNWLAVIFQQRVKTRTSWVLHGVFGTGKGMIFSKILLPLFGERYAKEVRMRNLQDQFNGWMEEAIIGVVDEIQVSSSDDNLLSSDLCNFITEDMLTVRHMNRMAYMARNYTNFLFFSNKDDPVEIKEGDRRYNVGDFQPVRFLPTDAEVDSIKDELPHFMNYIMQRPANAEKAGSILRTKSRTAMINASKNSLDMLADSLNDGDLTPFADAMPDTKMLAEIAGSNSALGVQYCKIVLRELQLLTDLTKPDKDGFYRVESRLSRDELFVLFEHAIGHMPTSPHKFTKLLKHKRLETSRIRINDVLVMGIKVVWVASQEWIDMYRPAPASSKVVPLKRKAT